jgi:hypothetical protein
MQMDHIGEKDGHQLGTEAWQSVFLSSFSQCGNITKSSGDAGVTRQAVFYAYKRHPDFRVLYDEAKEESIERLEEVARKRATDSSDNLLIFLLKSMRPEVYREVVRNENINMNMNANLDRLDRELSDDQISDLLSVMETRRAELEIVAERPALSDGFPAEPEEIAEMPMETQGMLVEDGQ